MKKIWPLWLFTIILFQQSEAQVTTLNYSNFSVNASCQATNDEENTSFFQMLACHCGPDYQVFADHYSTTPAYISSYVFQPGNTYTIQINGSATASGDLKSPLSSNAATIYFGISAGPAQYTNQITAFSYFPTYPSWNSGGSLAFKPPFPATWQGTSGVDLTNTFLTNVVGYGALPNSGAASNSTTTASFTVYSATTGFNIEAVPVRSDLNSPISVGEAGGTGVIYTGQGPTNTVISINSITITQTPIVYSAPTINGGSGFYFRAGQSSGGGTINGTPGKTVNITVSAGGPPNYTYTTTFDANGVVLSNGTSVITASNGSMTASVVVPASGTFSWTGNFSESNSEGSGAVSVSY